MDGFIDLHDKNTGIQEKRENLFCPAHLRKSAAEHI
jgi:hypothetical protein